MNPVVYITLSAVVFALLFIGFYLLMRSASLMDAARDNMNRIMQQLHDKEEKRVAQVELERRKYGSMTGSAKGEGLASRFLMSIDNKLIYSEISVSHPWLNASVYITLNIVVFCVALLLGMLFLNFVAGILIAVVVVMVPYAYITHLCNVNYRNTESQLKLFINLVASNSAMTGDLLTVLEMSAPYVINPIRGAIDRALSTAKLSEQTDEAIWQLTREIEHPMFVEFIRNLDISSKHKSDFRSVAKDFSVQADQSLKALVRRRAIFSNTRGEILTMLLLGIALLVLTASFCGTNIFALISEMSRSVLGLVCLLLEAVIFGSTIIYLVVGRRR